MKRKPMEGSGELEPWVEWQIRTMRNAGNIIRHFDVSVLDSISRSKTEWLAHIVRMGTEHRNPHLLKSILFWRPKAWWNEQVMYNELGWSPVKHPPDLGRPLRYEDQWSSNCMLAL